MFVSDPDPACSEFRIRIRSKIRIWIRVQDSNPEPDLYPAQNVQKIIFNSTNSICTAFQALLSFTKFFYAAIYVNNKNKNTNVYFLYGERGGGGGKVGGHGGSFSMLNLL